MAPFDDMNDREGQSAELAATPTSGPARWTLVVDRTDGAPRRLAVVGGVLLVVSAAFPWFTAGAIATDPLSGRGLVALVLGLAVIASSELVSRSTAVWQAVTAAATVVGLVLSIAAVLAPPRSLGPSGGVVACLVGSLLIGLGLFAARWRRAWSPPPEASPTGRSGGVDTVSGVTADTDNGVDAADEEQQGRSMLRRVLRYGGIAVAVVAAYLVVWPAPTPALESDPDPATSHAEALERYEQATADEDDGIFEPCRSQLYDHGETTEVAVVLFHGLTNCPKQFVEFGTRLHEAGANVLVLRAPEHGRANAAGTDIGSVANIDDLTAVALRDYADEAIDIGAGLGDEVRVLGLSMGGVITAWAAQTRPDVDRAVAIAPAITIPFVPTVATQVFRNVFHKLPNVSLPSGVRSTLDHAYPGTTTKGLDATFAMAAWLADSAYSDAPAAGDVVVVLNPEDEQVDSTHLAEFADAWASTGGPVRLHRLPAAGLRHDVVDPDHPNAQVDLVYPILEALLAGETP